MSDQAIERVTLEETETDFRSRVKAADARSDTWIDLARLWSELTVGATMAVDVFQEEERCFIVLEDAEGLASPPSALISRNVEILRRTLFGEAQKVLAIELGLSASSVATGGAHALRAMGFECTPSRIPLLVVMAAHAYYGRTAPVFARQSVLVERSRRYRVLSVVRPDPAVINSLSDAERSVVRLVLERRSNAEIARIRTTSTRTVANQLSTVLHKLRVNARSGILCRLIAAAASTVEGRNGFCSDAGDSRSRNQAEVYRRTSRIEAPDSYGRLETSS